MMVILPEQCSAVALTVAIQPTFAKLGGGRRDRGGWRGLACASLLSGLFCAAAGVQPKQASDERYLG